MSGDSPLDTDAEGATIDLRAWVKNWWDETKNPLYAWEAISRSAESGEPPPAWAAAYLRETAKNLLLLAHRRDFRDRGASAVTPDQAMALLGQALGLVAPGQKNAFARRSDDADAARAAMDAEFYDPPDAVPLLQTRDGERLEPIRHPARTELMQRRTITADRAQRIIARGAKLTRLPPGR